MKMMDGWRPQPRLRQKRPVDLERTDWELFSRLSLGDVWPDAGLIGVYKYMRHSTKCKIPSSWQCAFDDLDAELEKANAVQP